MAVELKRDQIRAALTLTDPAISSFLDLETGEVVKIDENATDPAHVELRDQVFASYGDRYRYIPGGNPSADDAAVASWIENEGL